MNKETGKSIPNTEILFEVYADGLAPTTNIKFKDAIKSVSNENVYFNGNLQIELSALDKTSGVDSINIRINENPVEQYLNPISFEKEGDYRVSWNSIDNVGNLESEKNTQFTIDASPPITMCNVNGMTAENVISTSSKVYLVSEDLLSGIDKVKYKFDEGIEKSYDGKTFDLNSLDEGEHELIYYSINRVGNKEEEKNSAFT